MSDVSSFELNVWVNKGGSRLFPHDPRLKNQITTFLAMTIG